MSIPEKSLMKANREWFVSLQKDDKTIAEWRIDTTNEHHADPERLQHTVHVVEEHAMMKQTKIKDTGRTKRVIE